MSLALNLPAADGALQPYTLRGRARLRARLAAARASTASPTRPRMWWPIRAPTSTPG